MADYYEQQGLLHGLWQTKEQKGDYSSLDEEKAVQEEILKQQLSNGRSCKLEMKESLSFVLPGYLDSLLMQMLSMLEKQVQTMLDNGRPSTSLHVSIPSAPLQESHEKPTTLFSSGHLKQASVVLLGVQQNLLDRIYAMSSEEQLSLAFKIYSVSKSLIGFRGSGDQLQQSLDVKALVTLLLNVGQCPGQVDPELVFRNDVFLLLVSAMSSMILEQGIVFLQHPVVMEAMQALENGSSAYVIACLAVASQTKLNDCQAFVSNLPLPKDVIALLNKYTDEASIVPKFYNGFDATQDQFQGDASFSFAEVYNTLLQETSFLANLVSPEKKKEIQELLRKKISLDRERKLVGESRDGYKRHTSQGDRRREYISVFVDEDLELMAVEDSDAETSIHDMSSFLKKKESPVEDEEEQYMVKLQNILKQQINETEKTIGDIPANRNHIKVKVLQQHVDGSCATVPDIPSSNTVTPTKVSEEVCSSHLLKTQGSEDNVSTIVMDAVTAASGGVVSRPPPTFSSWCWKRKLKPLDITYVQHFIRNGSQHVLEKQDTECHETICHAVISVCAPDSAAMLLHDLHKRSTLVFSHQDRYGNTPLHNAVMTGNLMIVNELLGIQPTVCTISTSNQEGDTPVDVAMHSDHHQIVKCILNQAIKHDAHSTNSTQLLQSYLVKAMKIGYTEYLNILLELRSQYKLEVAFECTDADQHTAWFHLNQKASNVQDTAIEILKRALIVKQGTETKTDTPLNTACSGESYLSGPLPLTESPTEEPVKSPECDRTEFNRCVTEQPLQTVSMKPQPTSLEGSLSATGDSVRPKPTSLQLQQQCGSESQKESSQQEEHDSLSQIPTPVSPVGAATYIVTGRNGILDMREKLSEEGKESEPQAISSPSNHESCQELLPSLNSQKLLPGSQTGFCQPFEHQTPPEHLQQLQEVHYLLSLPVYSDRNDSQPTSLDSAITDGSSSPAPPDMAVTRPVGSESSWEDSEEGNLGKKKKRRRFRYEYPPTDSVTSSGHSTPEKKYSTSAQTQEQRERASERLQRHRLPGSESDAKDNEKKHSRPKQTKQTSTTCGSMDGDSCIESSSSAIFSESEKLTSDSEPSVIGSEAKLLNFDGETDFPMEVEQKLLVTVEEDRFGVKSLQQGSEVTLAGMQEKRLVVRGDWFSMFRLLCFLTYFYVTIILIFVDMSYGPLGNHFKIRRAPPCRKCVKMERYMYKRRDRSRKTGRAILRTVKCSSDTSDNDSVADCSAGRNSSTCSNEKTCENSTRGASCFSAQLLDNGDLALQDLHQLQHIVQFNQLNSTTYENVYTCLHGRLHELITESGPSIYRSVSSRDCNALTHPSITDFSVAQNLLMWEPQNYKCQKVVVISDEINPRNLQKLIYNFQKILLPQSDGKPNIQVHIVLGDGGCVVGHSSVPPCNSQRFFPLTHATKVSKQLRLVLGSCDSAKDTYRYGVNEIEGMTRSFLKAGVQTVLLTESELNDECTFAFMHMVDRTEPFKAMFNMRYFHDHNHFNCSLKVIAMKDTKEECPSAHQLSNMLSDLNRAPQNMKDLHQVQTMGLFGWCSKIKSEILSGDSGCQPKLFLSLLLEPNNEASVRLALSDKYLNVLMLHLSLYFPTYSCSSLCEARIIRIVGVQQTKPQHSITSRLFEKSQQDNVKPSARNKFKAQLLHFIKKREYSLLKKCVHPEWYSVFGLSPLRGVRLTKHQKRKAKVVLEVVESKKSSIPEYVVLNLRDLIKIIHPDAINTDETSDRRGGGRNTKKDKPKRNAKEVKKVQTLSPVLGSDSDYCTGTGTATATTPDDKPKHFHAPTTSAVVCHSDSPVLSNQNNDTLNSFPNAGGVHIRPLPTLPELEIPKQERSTEISSLGFTNTSNPLEVIRSHLTTYSKCCPRHDIQNIVVVGTTCPASDAFGPKRRYSSIKDIRDDTRHAPFDASKPLTGKGNSDVYMLQQSHQVMSDRPMTASVRRDRSAMAHLVSEPATTESRELSARNISKKEPTGNQGYHSKTGNGDGGALGELHISVEERRGKPAHSRNPVPNPATRNIHPTDPLPSIQRSSLPTHPRVTPSIPQHLLGDHKDRLRTAAELLHAQDFPRIFPISYEGKPPLTLPPETRIPYVFITALAFYKLSNHKKSVFFFQQCLQLAEECRRDGDVTICCIYIGDIEFAQRKYIEAAERYQKALHCYSRDSVAKEFRMILPTQAAVWSKCGSAFKNASRIGDSITAFEHAIEQAKTKKDKLGAHTSLGNLYQGIGDNGRAVTEYESAMQLATELKDDVSLGWNHGNLGNALLGLQQRDKALHHLFKALDMAVAHETTPQAIGRAYNNLGTAYQSLVEHDKAEEYYDLALAQAIYGNDIPGQARVYGNIGNLQMIKKQFDRAVPHYTEVMRLSQDKSTVTTAHHNRGCAYYDWGEKKKNALVQRTSQTPLPAFKVSLHGPEFEHCDEIYRPVIVPNSIQKYFLQGTRDLEYVMKHHEENFNGIKGSPKGLSLSVSLFETNSRTFHRMQDCLIHLKNADSPVSRFEEALLVAEQSRARTLGELMLKRRGPQLEHELVSPPSLDQLKSIVSRQECPVVYFSYTGERLLGWVLFPTSGNSSVNMFEVPLSDKEFDGKSFDYHLRYSLNEQLVEKSFEMYKPFEYGKELTDPVVKLYDLVAEPLMVMLEKLEGKKNEKKVRKIIIVPDSYTNLLPFTCVFNERRKKFWGDDHYFQIVPSLLTMGIMDQLPSVSVTIPVEHQQMMCVVGNPTIPMFKYNDEEWNLGKLPHATKEAEWVSHILKCKPILHEHATKDAVIMRAMNAKVIHLATHGSAVAGFLAFAGMSAAANEIVEAKKVLIYPEEIESLNISPALVVLSSCDSGRGVFKADGIQGMARAFLLAGAQAVLTTLWRVPDESACIFMQFFYQYLVDGVRGTEALHKAMLCVRCFSKYSQYIHWSGYQLTGREIQFSVNHSSSAAELMTRLGKSSVFPQLDVLKNLETAFLNTPRPPTDVQVLRGPPGVKPSEPLIDFIHCHHLHFTGGIFWINCRTTELINASVKYITNTFEQKDLSELPGIDSQPSLIVLDSPGQLPNEDSQLYNILKKENVHIVVISKNYVAPDSLQKEIHHKLIRGTNTIEIHPLSTIHATQRLVHSVLKKHHLAPSMKEQMTFEKLAEFTTGSPAIIDLASSLLDLSLQQAECSVEQALQEFAKFVQLNELPLAKPLSVFSGTDELASPPQEHQLSRTVRSGPVTIRNISQAVYNTIKTTDSDDVWTTNADYDSWQVVTVLIKQCNLSPEEQLLLNCLSNFTCSPIPTSYVTEISTIIAKASHQPHLASSLHTKLENTKMLMLHPKPTVYHPSLPHNTMSEAKPDTDFMYVPKFIAEAVWKDMMTTTDKAMALGIVYRAFQNTVRQSHNPSMEHPFLLGIGSLLVESCELNFELLGKSCFQDVYSHFLSLLSKNLR